ncbi:hypothetical protein KSZ02_08450 [Bacteroides thetaiotaomicron]|uniref:hypothetical protein n=1 Tax=Bacteroides thetaiotaomicron TaxID=818 RepID=UPI001C37C9E8|nr:hypothetical protein [Bacteroides thetaiotaomicron]MBV4088411.1 hypothetical protein [Bacteroides thetaiotaomicron]MBV4100247.1 hypothetical protein [Bacteroides thetaiotaomicron]MBV4135976.1 hypothetical protein [Bacteroides thetaiotaomicron]MCS2964154.1 hypothetical protein [Bacteroides thetaiotaomicron]UVV52773.1 hypothetical protein NXY15_25205 [Bacteroides thetaiotaomicron]
MKIKIDYEKGFEKSNFFITSYEMLSTISNQLIVKYLVDYGNTWSVTHINPLVAVKAKIAELDKFDLVKVTFIRINETEFQLVFKRVRSYMDLLESYCIVKNINAFIAGLIDKTIYGSSIASRVHESEFFFEKQSVKSPLVSSPITILIPNEDKLNSLRDEYSIRNEDIYSVEIPLQDYSQNNANEVVPTEDAGHLIIASNVEDATIIED